MVSLTTTQRDLLHLLLTSETPVGAAVLGQRLHLTPRQVHYGLRDLKPWLSRRHVTLRHTPGVGIQIVCPPDQRRRLQSELSAQARFQLVLTPGQRQQLLALQLLAACDPLTISQLQADVLVARATALKDLDVVEQWLQAFGLQIERRQHRGNWVSGAELARRQALAALIWGDVPFDWPILALRHNQGIVFALAKDATLLPLVGRLDELLRRWDTLLALEQVAWAEEQLGGRFTDDAMLQLALAVALQDERIRTGRLATCDPLTIEWLRAQVAWTAAAAIGERLWPALAPDVRDGEIAALAMQLLASARDRPWRRDLGADAAFAPLIDGMIDHIGAAYNAPELRHDQLLRDGLEAHILVACVRQRFGLWVPSVPETDTQTERYTFERTVARQLADHIGRAEMALPDDAYDDLVLLLRAAFIRARPERARRVLVVCPSGMATTQLLVARLKARFPRLGTFEVLSMRELNVEQLASADLIISTIPLDLPAGQPIDIIQVHPMLRADDVAALTQWMADANQ
jgi:mannitol operon transcriptional antiterminator